MPDLVKAVALIDGKETEVELAKIPEGFIPQSEFSRRTKSITDKALEEALGNEEFRGKALTAWGIDLTKKKGDGDEKAIGDRLTKQREEWETKELSPLKKQLETASQRATRLLEKQLHSEILLAAEKVGVKPEFRQPLGGGMPPVIAGTAPQFKFDEKTERWYVKEGDDFKWSAKGSKEAPYMSIEEFFDEFSKDSKNASYLVDQKQRVGGVNSGSGTQRGGVVTISRADARIKSKYDEAVKAAGGDASKVRVVD